MSPGDYRNSTRVYSSEDRRRAEGDPRSAPGAEQTPASSGFPRDGVVRVSRTTSGRKGKTVTLVHGLPAADLRAAARDLKRLCGSGGAVKDGVIEIQGDHRERIAEHLAARHEVKVAGG
jgi:translation initiation factor 1